MKFTRILATATAAMVFLGLAGLAQATETPATLPGTTLVSADQVKQLMDKGVPVIDARVAAEYSEGHIKGAKNIPYKEKSAKAVDFDPSQDKFDLGQMPADKKAPVVLYCNAGDCWRSFKAATMSIKAGYTKIHWFRGGFPEWKAKGYPVE